MSVQLPNSVFLHVPKCGGNWIMKCLKQQGLYKQQIRSVSRFQSFERNFMSMHCIPVDNKLPCFTFVRHPLTWFKSYWNYKMKRGMFDLTSMLGKVNGEPRFVNQFDLTTGMQGGKEDFNKWVRNVYATWPEYYARMVEHFSTPCEDKNVGRQETLEADYVEILSRLEPQAKMGPIQSLKGKLINTFGSENTATEYDPEARRMVLAMGQPVIERWY
jgi:hypothetical protein